LTDSLTIFINVQLFEQIKTSALGASSISMLNRKHFYALNVKVKLSLH